MLIFNVHVPCGNPFYYNKGSISINGNVVSVFGQGCSGEPSGTVTLPLSKGDSVDFSKIWIQNATYASQLPWKFYPYK